MKSLNIRRRQHMLLTIVDDAPTASIVAAQAARSLHNGPVYCQNLLQVAARINRYRFDGKTGVV